MCSRNLTERKYFTYAFLLFCLVKQFTFGKIVQGQLLYPVVQETIKKNGIIAHSILKDGIAYFGLFAHLTGYLQFM